MAVKGNNLTQRRRAAEKVRSVPLWSVTTWDKKFNAVTKDKQKKVIKYHYFLASELEPIVEIGGTVKILTTYESDLWTAESKVQGCVSEGEIVSIPWGGNPNVQYFKGRFVTADNRIATSSDTSILSNRYLFYFMLAKKDLIGSFYRGASLKHPEMSKVLDMKIPLPPLPAQRRIAAELDKICELKKNVETRLEKLDLLVKSRFVEMFGDPNENPRRWKFIRLLELMTHANNGMTRRGCDVEGEIVLRIVELRDGYIDYSAPNRIKLTNKEREKFLLCHNDFLFVRVNGNPQNVGRCARFVDVGEPVYHNDHIIRVKFDERVDVVYMSALLNGSYGKDQIRSKLKTSAGQYTINQDGIGEIIVPLPPLAFQREFAAFVEKVDKLRLNMQETVSKMDTLYRSKLQEYFG